MYTLISILDRSYLAKFVAALGLTGAMFSGIAGGYYTLYQFVTWAGN